MRYNTHSLPARLYREFLKATRPRRTVQAQNAWNLYGDIAWYGILSGIITSFLPVFTLRLGGSDLQVGLLSALPALVTTLVSLPGSRFVEGETRPLSVLIVTVTLHRLGYLAIGLLPFFLVSNQAWGVVVLVVLLSIPLAIANVAFTTMFADVVMPEHRARVVSVRNILVGITSTGIALVGGKFLDMVLFPVNYQVLFITGFAASMVSTYYLTRIEVPARRAQVTRRAEETIGGLRDFLSMLHSSPGYTRFTVTSFIFQWGLFFTVPLYSIWWVRTLHASDGWVGLITMVGSASTVLFYPLWGRLTAKRGNRLAMIVTTAGLAGYPLLTILSPTVEWMLCVSFWGGIFVSGQTISFFNGLLEVCPEPHRAARIAAYNSLANLAAFASPLISTALIGPFGIHAMLIAGGLLRLFGSFLIWQQRVLDKEQEVALARAVQVTQNS